MKIADEGMLRKFDKMKEDILMKKRQEGKKKVVNPITPKIRVLLPLGLIAGGLWLVYKNMPNIRDVLLEKEIVTYQQLLAYEALKKSLRCRWEGLIMNPREHSSPHLATQLYLTTLESDYLYLSQKRPERVVDFEQRTRWSFWMFNFGNQEKIRLINEYGDLMERKSNCKLMLGQSLRIWGGKKDRIDRRQKIFEHYLKERGAIGGGCETVNIWNRMFSKQEQYDKSLQMCKERVGRVSAKIEKFMDGRLKEQKKRKIQLKTI